MHNERTQADAKTRCRVAYELAPKCWNGYSPYAHKRQTFERCDRHSHRPKRADWRAKAYERQARWLVDAWSVIVDNRVQLFPIRRNDACLGQDHLGSNATETCS